MFGFPWNLAGYITLASTQTAQLASVAGTFGLSLMVVLAGVMPVLLILSTHRLTRIVAILVPVLLIAGAYGYGYLRIPPTIAAGATQIRIVQPSIPQTLKGTREGVGKSAQTLASLSRMAPPADITLWPETAYPGAIRDRAEMYSDAHGILLTGVVRLEGKGETLRLYNSFAAINPNGEIITHYDKHQLVPFGEFVPLRSVLPLDKITPGNIDFSRGPGAQTIRIAGLPAFSPLICYEVIFPWMAVDPKDRPDWIVNVTNDGWYGDSPGPYQHFVMARMRAIEQGLPLARAANNGISAVIDPFGRKVTELPLNGKGNIQTNLPLPLPPTLYNKVGELITFVSLFMLLTVTFLPTFRNKNK
jgi:apolipoprotein N-acyltransferase